MTSASDRLEQLETIIYPKVLELIRLLRESKKRIVLAESCTGGLVAATLTSVPGASDVFCGSMVVYRNDTKTKWLGLDPEMLADEKIGPVSPQASEALAQQVLSITPEADVALAVTGHLGPNAPRALEGKVFLAGLSRDEYFSKNLASGQKPLQKAKESNLESSSFFHESLAENRRFMQSLALWETLCFGVDLLKEV
ncbi:MAG: CinA family protein [Pirellula sp.]